MDNRSQSRLRDWLLAFGFSNHPFQHTEAEQDPRLHEYFVEPACFDAVLGTAESPQSAVLFAPRGGGKTANRVMVDYFCDVGERLERPVLSISYTDFDRLIDFMAWGPQGVQSKVNVNHHLTQILGASASETVEALTTRRLILDRGSESAWRTLFDILAVYGTTEDMFHITPLLRNLEWHSEEFQDRLWQIHAQTDSDSLNPSRDFRTLVSAFVALGVDAIYVLVDRIDEFHPASFDALAGAVFLGPLLSHLSLLEMDHIAFKFFLPSHMKSVLLDRGLRPDRLTVEEIVWSDEDLLRTLNSRLYVFSERQVPTLEPLFVSSQVAANAEQRLVACAEGSPRDLILACNQLFVTHARHFVTDEELRIGHEALDQAIETFTQERARWRPIPSRLGFQTH